MPGSAENATAVVFNIQHYCIHDGPGIRTNVFVKGCPLRCVWCANPESQCHTPQLMYLENKCTGCGGCLEVCPRKAITRLGGHVVHDRTKCIGCGACAEVCPNAATEITGKVMTAEAAFEEVSQDTLFYGSDGGVTVTGGEALAYPAFTGTLVRMCKNAGISTAIETCGAVSWEVMEPILQDTDYVLYDIKHMDSDAHKRFTGMDNSRILQNLVNISEKTNCTIIVRCPVIPPCNDTADNMHQLGRFLSENHIRCSEINLLPYHNMGLSKRKQLEADMEQPDFYTPSETDMETLRNILRGYGYTVK